VSIEQPSLEEKQAIARLKQGDLVGLETLVEHYQVQAVSTAYLILRDMKMAEDVVQTAFLRAAEKIDQFDENRLFKAWFLRSVINASIKAAKRQQRLTPLDEDNSTSAMVNWLLDPNPSPEEIVETEDTRRMVWNALEQLSAQQRAVVVMRHFLEMNETEMTRQLNRPGTTVRWWLRSARKRLKELLFPFWEDKHAGMEEERMD
jgi:RNA polymerase sigma-70 factor (ECF subfamily)